MTQSWDRRRLLQTLGAAGLLASAARAQTLIEKWRSPDNPFRLGVASGYPTHNSVVLWTLLAPQPLAPSNGMPPEDIAVQWQLATDETFRRIVARGQARAEASFSHSARIEVKGLSPARQYFYRFLIAGHASPTGRTRTLPMPGAKTAALKIAVGNCQHFEHAHFAAWAHAAQQSPDLVLHLGDYIYEGSPTPGALRLHHGGLCRTLDEYRLRYTQYQTDASLQAAHAAAPWLVTWDDHEVANDYSGVHSGRAEDPAAFLARRTAAYRAYYEHLPLPPSAAPRGIEIPLFARRQIGDLASIHMLDQRQYRSQQACGTPQRPGGNRADAACTDLYDTQRSMLGEAQEAWIAEGFSNSNARWNLIANATLMTHLDEQVGQGVVYGTDNWNGYPAARDRLIHALQEKQTRNPVMLSGDIHAFMASHIHEQSAKLDTPIIAPEFTATSIASNPRPQTQLDSWLPDNPNLLLAEGRSRGYLQLQLSQQQLAATLWAVDEPGRADSDCRVFKRYMVEAGDPRIKSA